MGSDIADQVNKLTISDITKAITSSIVYPKITNTGLLDVFIELGVLRIIYLTALGQYCKL